MELARQGMKLKGRGPVSPQQYALKYNEYHKLFLGAASDYNLLKIQADQAQELEKQQYAQQKLESERQYAEAQAEQARQRSAQEKAKAEAKTRSSKRRQTFKEAQAKADALALAYDLTPEQRSRARVLYQQGAGDDEVRNAFKPKSEGGSPAEKAAESLTKFYVDKTRTTTDAQGRTTDSPPRLDTVGTETLKMALEWSDLGPEIRKAAEEEVKRREDDASFGQRTKGAWWRPPEDEEAAVADRIARMKQIVESKGMTWTDPTPDVIEDIRRRVREGR